MEITNLEVLIKRGENFRLEVKKASDKLPESLWESYSAFANTEGGVILLGISESGSSFSITGVANASRKVKNIWDQLNDQKRVSANVLLERHVYVQKYDGKELIVMEIPRADRHDKPVYINDDLFNGTYRRNAEGDYHCSKAEIKSMLRDQSDSPIDGVVIDEFAWDELDLESVKRYRNRFASLKPAHIWNNLAHDEFLQKLGAVKKSLTGDLKPTLAGLLMFGTEDKITHILPDYFLDYREKFTYARWSDRVYSTQGEWSGNLFDFFFKVVSKLTADVKVPFQMRNSIERIDDTPVHIALREALANAIIHADYYGRRGVVIEKDTNRLRICNPGIFRPRIEEAWAGGISDPRNPFIFKMFTMIDVGERIGSGLYNIHNVWQSMGWPSPEFSEEFSPERTVLSVEFEREDSIDFTKNVSEPIEIITTLLETDQKPTRNRPETDQKPTRNRPETDQKINLIASIILQLIEQNNQITIAEIAKQINKGTTVTKDWLARLKSKGLIERIGPDKGGYWKVKE